MRKVSVPKIPLSERSCLPNNSYTGCSSHYSLLYKEIVDNVCVSRSLTLC